MSIENQDLEGVPLRNYVYKPVLGQSKQITTVATPCAEYLEMAEAWELPEALMGGTRKMRKGRTTWLPQEPKEDLRAYNNRLKRTVLFNAYGRTVTTLCGLPFTYPVTIENIPPSLSYLIEDADSMGGDITSLAYSLLKDQVHLGITHLLVDMPTVVSKVTLQEQKTLKLRPYFTKISPLNLISWSSERVGGLTVLTEIRIKEIVTEKDGWGEKEYEQVRVVTPESFIIWRKIDEKWEQLEPVVNELGFIPLVTIYGNQTGFMTGLPPMEDLAWLNLRHYQKVSDQDNIIHVASVPILFGSGFDEGEMDGVSIGPNTLLTASRESADLKYVEHSGAAIGAAEVSIEKLQERMAALGADLIVRKSVDRQTATSRKIDQSESISLLQSMINALETGLQQAIKYAGMWMDEEVADVTANIGDGLDTSNAGPNLLDILTNFLIENQGMSVEQAANELRRRGVLSDTFKVKQNAAVKQTPSVTPEKEDAVEEVPDEGDPQN